MLLQCLNKKDCGFGLLGYVCVVFTRATRSIARYMLRQRGWLGGWLAVCHSRYCV